MHRLQDCYSGPQAGNMFMHSAWLSDLPYLLHALQVSATDRPEFELQARLEVMHVLELRIAARSKQPDCQQGMQCQCGALDYRGGGFCRWMQPASGAQQHAQQSSIGHAAGRFPTADPCKCD